MILISHRGNTVGRREYLENDPSYIDLAISKGYDVEIDVWCTDNVLYLGHDNPQYEISFKWLVDRIHKLWIHCKNIGSITFFKSCGYEFNYFWHESDTVTLTSKGHIWAYPGKQPIENSIAVMPEIKDDPIDLCIGVCSDYIFDYEQMK